MIQVLEKYLMRRGKSFGLNLIIETGKKEHWKRSATHTLNFE